MSVFLTLLLPHSHSYIFFHNKKGQVLSAGTPQTETLPPRTDFDFFDPQGHLPTSSIPKAPPRAYDPFLSKKRIASNTTTPQKGGSSSASSGSSSSSSPPFLFQDWPALFSKKRKGILFFSKISFSELIIAFFFFFFFFFLTPLFFLLLQLVSLSKSPTLFTYSDFYSFSPK